MQESESVQEKVGHLFRHEAGRMTSVLTRLLGVQAWEEAEDIVQDTLLQALGSWKLKGVPDNPSAWLYTVARRKAVDKLRQRRMQGQHHTVIGQALYSEYTLSPAVQQLFLDNEIEDSQLRMMFACCHPSIAYEAQLALILKTLCGLSVGEIAHSFRTHEETIGKRLYRAREKIREEKIALELPPSGALPARLDAVLHAIYLLFNEGYHSAHPDKLIRHELCAEAIRLGLLLLKNPVTALPGVYALLALMCFQASREDARTTAEGSMILLKEQDRSRWNTALIKKAEYFLEVSATGEEISAYHVEASIASCHAQATTFGETDWSRIVQLYNVLETIKPGPFVALNRAIAIGYAFTPTAGINALRAIPDMQNDYLCLSALGDFYAADHAFIEARSSYERALQQVPTNAGRMLLQHKLAALPLG
ncbi:RNA polymerase sigma factor [Parachryseolinea silvisoli]|uniref:RNA polymerase sigma factor n=1 Tax=Parachryseolinea silvisoli TaxID=2873601 RepID=UPI002265E954|nr:sigma-70 family RNA polymerase sigma factor [Parachryseolinea silvisoli]MCD9016921.1 sigma-70 family RNA polymerase sigma factor [Parachryseolinea silvisoli]